MVCKHHISSLFSLDPGVGMTDSGETHQGIELDTIDLSALVPQEVSLRSPRQGQPLDSKKFIATILKKMHQNDSFLSFSVQINDVNRILGMKYSSASDIADVILKDMALSTKLLKLVNSSFYGNFTNKGVATVSEAMIILGTEEIKLAAASLKVYEFMKNIASIRILKDKTIQALQRSIIARQIAVNENIKDAEAIQISAMLYDFGQYLVALFSPQVFIDVELLMDQNGLNREDAAKAMIGVTYSELGRFIAAKWKLPASIVHAMKPLDDFHVDRRSLSVDDIQRYICSFTNDICNIDFTSQGDTIGRTIVEISDKYKQCLEIPPTQIVELVNLSREKIKTHKRALEAAA